MRDSIALTAREAEALVHTLEDAALVHRRHQFFVWTQGQFQTLLPHKVLVCGTYHRQRRALVFDTFNSVALSADVQASLCNVEGALMRAATAQWVAGGGRSVAITRLTGSAAAELERLNLVLDCEHLLLHGVARPQRAAEIESLFVVSIEQETSLQRAMSMLDLLLPHIHIVWRHVQAIERAQQEAGATVPAPLPVETEGARQLVTDRERQILLWMREGMSNPQIGELLSISPLTVKNHVQKILRKLNAANRAHAVAQAMTLNLLHNDDGRAGAR